MRSNWINLIKPSWPSSIKLNWIFSFLSISVLCFGIFLSGCGGEVKEEMADVFNPPTEYEKQKFMGQFSGTWMTACQVKHQTDVYVRTQLQVRSDRVFNMTTENYSNSTCMGRPLSIVRHRGEFIITGMAHESLVTVEFHYYGPFKEDDDSYQKMKVEVLQGGFSFEGEVLAARVISGNKEKELADSAVKRLPRYFYRRQ